MKLQDLINEVIDAVKKLFHPEVKAIKVQIDSLIEREVSQAMPRLWRFDADIYGPGSTLSGTRITGMCSLIWPKPAWCDSVRVFSMLSDVQLKKAMPFTKESPTLDGRANIGRSQKGRYSFP